MKFVAIDFETTGLFAKRDRVIEIGLVRFSDDFQIEDEFSSLINPGRDVGRTDIHGITPTMLVDAPTFADIAPQVFEFINGSVLVAHNKKFDLDFLAAELKRAGIEPPELDAICTIELIRSAYPTSPRRLQDACTFLGIEIENAHEALSDARMAARIAITILRDHGFPALPDPTSVTFSTVSTPSLVKTRQSSEYSRPQSYLASLVAKLPETTLVAGTEAIAANEYLNLLDRVIEDRIIDEDEAALLVMLAHSLGLSSGAVRMLNSSYLYALCKSARADCQVSESERRDIRLVAEGLGLEGWEELLDKELDEQVVAGQVERSMPVGTTVCFTGQMDLARSACEEAAARKGLVVCSRVTKDVVILVVADPRTQSNKAQRARKYGARIMSEQAFFREIDKYPNVSIASSSNADADEFGRDALVIEVGGRIFPLFGFAMDEVAAREREIIAGFSSMVRHVSPSLLHPDLVKQFLARLRDSATQLTTGELLSAEACELARGIVLDLWSHVRAVADQWQEPTTLMASSVARFEELTVVFLARSQAIAEARQDEDAARGEIAGLICDTSELMATYEPQAHSSHLYLRERRLRDAGVIPNEMLDGLSIVVTGEFLEFERDQAHRAILERGGKSPGSLSGRTYALVAGENAGWAKLEKALGLGTPVIGYAEFLTILDRGELPGVPKWVRETKPGEKPLAKEVIERFLCVGCGREFSRKRTTGRKPHQCPECRGIGPGV